MSEHRIVIRPEDSDVTVDQIRDRFRQMLDLDGGKPTQRVVSIKERKMMDQDKLKSIITYCLNSGIDFIA